MYSITTYNNGKPRPWKPSGPTRISARHSRRERQILSLILDGQASDFAKAIALMRKPCDYAMIVFLSKRRRCTGRVLKAMITGNKIISAEIPPDEAAAHIRGLAVSAGNRG